MGYPNFGWSNPLVKAATCIIVVVLIYQESRTLIPWYFARDLGRSHPSLQKIPQPLPDTAVASLDGTTWKTFGCSMQLPWKEVQKDRNGKSFAVRSFTDGAGIIFFSSDFEADGPRIIRESAGREQSQIVHVLGEENLASRFNFMRASMYTRPQDASLFATKERNIRTLVFLGLKGTVLDGPLFELHQGDFRGFQVGDPSQVPFKISLELFDNRDRQYKFLLSSNKSSAVRVTQPQINAIIQSLHCL